MHLGGGSVQTVQSAGPRAHPLNDRPRGDSAPPAVSEDISRREKNPRVDELCSRRQFTQGTYRGDLLRKLLQKIFVSFPKYPTVRIVQ